MFNQTPVLLHTQQDFELRSLNTDTALCLKNPKTPFSLVFFYGPDCDSCDIMRPIFSRNSGIIQECSFIMVNLKNNQSLIHASNQTRTPIKYVPYILLYHEKLPLVEFNGSEYSDKALRTFLVDAVTHFGKPLQNARGPVTPRAPATPDYVCRDGLCYQIFGVDAGGDAGPLDVCHLSFENAYDGR
jgi:hypothetical protein